MGPKTLFFDTTWGRAMLGTIAILLAINGFFVSRLVSSIDGNGGEIVNLQVRVAVVETQLTAVNKKLDDFSEALNLSGINYHPRNKKPVLRSVDVDVR